MMHRGRNVFFLIFVFSGFSGLIYESIWTHYLKLFLGHAAYAQTLVLAIFMGGLTIGSWICSSYSGRWSKLFRGYAYAEAAIGFLALVFHPIFVYVTGYAYTVVLPSLGSPAAINAVKWTFSALLILPQTILLGMTFPLMSAALLRWYPDTPGRSVAMLYFTNSIGAAVGVLVSGFFLIRIAGLPGTIVLAGCINIALAGTVWYLARTEDSEARPVAILEEPSGAADSAWYRYLLLASLVTGVASFIYEIGWIRMLSLVMGSSTHAFELMLSAFIFGLAFGGLWLQRRIDGMVNPVRSLVFVQIAMGLLALATLPLYEQSFSIMAWLLNKLPKTDTGYVLFNVSSTIIALSVMLPATFCAGMTLPLITATLIKRGHGERSVGAVYAMNTVGAIIGVFGAIHLGMPLLGLKGLITAGASLDMALGLLLFLGIRKKGGTAALAGAAAVCVCAVLATLFFVTLDPYKMASGVYRARALLERVNSSVLYHKDGKTATVSITEHHDDKKTWRSIRTNGKVDAAVNVDLPHHARPDETTMMMAAALPLLYHPGARTAAVIGLGSGLTSHTLLCSPRLAEVDTIEIEREMTRAAKLFGANVDLVYTDQRSRLFIDDAKTFFASHNKKYDIIISEPSNPWVSGVAGLFSDEFYLLIRRHLAEKGIFVQWIQLYEIDLDLVASIFKALGPHFSYFVVYTPNYADLVIVARNEGSVQDPDPSIFGVPRFAEQLRKIHVKTLEDIETRKIGTKKMLSPFFDSFPLRPNSDYYPVLDQNAARARFLGSSAQDLIRLSTEPLPIVDILSLPENRTNHTRVTLSEFHPKTKAVGIAMALRDYFLQNGRSSALGGLDAETQLYAAGARKLFTDCRSAGDPNNRIFLFNAAKNMIPYLTPSESRAVWKKLASGPCANRLSPMEKSYVSLFSAIGDRNGPAMEYAASFLLEHEQDITPARLKYVVAAAMLGDLAQGHGQAAEKVWGLYGDRIKQGREQDFIIRFLRAQAAGM